MSRRIRVVDALLIGFSSSLALIIAIGAQNAFVLRQGLKREHVLVIVCVCVVADGLLTIAGVAGMGALIQERPRLLDAVRLGGVAFLVGYAALAARRAFASSSMAVAGGGAPLSLTAAVVTLLGFTFLNPHVYLDTVVLLGAIGSQQPENLRLAFVVGSVTASAIWFVSLGYGARFLTPLFARPRAWRILDGLIAAVMIALALALLVSA